MDMGGPVIIGGGSIPTSTTLNNTPSVHSITNLQALVVQTFLVVGSFQDEAACHQEETLVSSIHLYNSGPIIISTLDANTVYLSPSYSVPLVLASSYSRA